MTVYSYTKSQLEETLDTAKLSVMKALVDEGLIDAQKADDWCAGHTVVLRDKSIWRTLTDRWAKMQVGDHFFMTVVRLV